MGGKPLFGRKPPPRNPHLNRMRDGRRNAPSKTRSWPRRRGRHCKDVSVIGTQTQTALSVAHALAESLGLQLLRMYQEQLAALFRQASRSQEQEIDARLVASIGFHTAVIVPQMQVLLFAPGGGGGPISLTRGTDSPQGIYHIRDRTLFIYCRKSVPSGLLPGTCTSAMLVNKRR